MRFHFSGNGDLCAFGSEMRLIDRSRKRGINSCGTENSFQFMGSIKKSPINRNSRTPPLLPLNPPLSNNIS